MRRSRGLEDITDVNTHLQLNLNEFPQLLLRQLLIIHNRTVIVNIQQHHEF